MWRPARCWRGWPAARAGGAARGRWPAGGCRPQRAARAVRAHCGRMEAAARGPRLRRGAGRHDARRVRAPRARPPYARPRPRRAARIGASRLGAHQAAFRGALLARSGAHGEPSRAQAAGRPLGRVRHGPRPLGGDAMDAGARQQHGDAARGAAVGVGCRASRSAGAAAVGPFRGVCRALAEAGTQLNPQRWGSGGRGRLLRRAARTPPPALLPAAPPMRRSARAPPAPRPSGPCRCRAARHTPRAPGPRIERARSCSAPGQTPRRGVCGGGGGGAQGGGWRAAATGAWGARGVGAHARPASPLAAPRPSAGGGTQARGQSELERPHPDPRPPGSQASSWGPPARRGPAWPRLAPPGPAAPDRSLVCGDVLSPGRGAGRGFSLAGARVASSGGRFFRPCAGRPRAAAAQPRAPPVNAVHFSRAPPSFRYHRRLAARTRALIPPGNRPASEGGQVGQCGR
jgi:hypothetical protein